MHLQSLSLTSFRNYIHADVKFSPRINFIYGLNAQGKTNFLEAVYLLCLGRSFRAAKNQELIKKDAELFRVQGAFAHDNNIQKNIAVQYSHNARKEILIDGKRLTSHAAIFGQFPVVVMAPDEFKITTGSPSERRKFIDILLSQVNVRYLAELQDYHRVVKQRNKLLQQIREGVRISEDSLRPWNEQIAILGAKITTFRLSFLKDFTGQAQHFYKKLTKRQDTIEIRIESTLDLYNREVNSQTYLDQLAMVNKKEKILGVTLIGPHRDDLVFNINDFDIRKYGSRGEHKSLLIALKVAEYHYILQRREETPIFLLDDCYSELDHFREQGVFDSFQKLGQVFMTSPKQDFKEKKSSNIDALQFHVTDGQMQYVS